MRPEIEKSIISNILMLAYPGLTVILDVWYVQNPTILYLSGKIIDKKINKELIGESDIVFLISTFYSIIC